MKKNIDATKGPLLKQIILFSLPIIATNVLQALYTIADEIVVGQCAGKTALSAIGDAFPVVELSICIMLGLGMGVNVLISQAFGADDRNKMNRLVHTALITSLILGIIMGAFLFGYTRKIVEAMGTPKDVEEQAVLYLRIYYLGFPANFIYTFGAAMLRSVGDSRKPLIYLTISGIVNVILNLILDVGFGLGVAGVAIGTVASQVLSAVLVILSLKKGDGPLKFRWRELRMDWSLCGQILRFGIPCGIQYGVFSLSNVVMQSTINAFGSAVMAGSAAAVSVENLIYVSMQAFQETTMTIVGQNYGARKIRRMYKSVLLCLLSVSVVGILVGLFCFFFREPVLRIFIREANPEILAAVVRAGAIRLIIVGPTYFLCGLMDCTAATLRGTGVTITPMIISLVGSCIFRLVYLWTFIDPMVERLSMAGADLMPALWRLFLVYPITWLVTTLVQGIAILVVRHKLIQKYGNIDCEAT